MIYSSRLLILKPCNFGFTGCAHEIAFLFETMIGVDVELVFGYQPFLGGLQFPQCNLILVLSPLVILDRLDDWCIWDESRELVVSKTQQFGGALFDGQLLVVVCREPSV